MEHLEKFVRLPQRVKAPVPIVDRTRVDREWAERALLTQQAAEAAEAFEAELAARQKKKPVSLFLFWTLVIKNRRATRDAALSFACEAFNVTPEDILGRQRKQPIVKARRAALGMVYIARPDLSLPALAGLFGLDHTSVIYALRKLDIYQNRSSDEQTQARNRLQRLRRLEKSAARVAAGYPVRAPNAKLTTYQAERVRWLLSQNVKHAAIAHEFGVTLKVISRVANGRTYKTR